MVVSLIYVYDLFVIGSSPSVTSLDKFGDHLHYQAFSASMHRNVQSHLKVFLQFCNNFHFHSFSLQPIVLSCYVAHLAQLGHWSGTIQNHISSLKQFQEYMVLLWAGNKLTLWGAKHFLGLQANRKQANRKQAIPPIILHSMTSHFDLHILLHTAMWALF